MSGKQFFPLLFIFPVLLVLVTAPLASLNVSASNSNSNIPDTSGNGQGIAVGEQNPNADDSIPVEPDNGPGTTTGGGGTTCDEDDDQCGNSGPFPPGPPFPSGSNLAESNQVGGLGSGNINQQAQGEVNKQLCSTVGGIGNRQCQQSATPGAQNLQDCTAVAGLGKANCVQSENPSGPDTCLTANGKPFICETGTGTSLSGSGQAGQ